MPMPMPMSVALMILTCFVVVSVDAFVVVSVVEGHLFNTFLFYIFKISSKMEKRSTISQSLTIVCSKVHIKYTAHTYTLIHMPIREKVQ